MSKPTTENANIDPYSEIIELLASTGIDYKLIRHEPVFTSKQAEAISGLSLSQGAKSILLSAGDIFVLAILPGDKKLDTKKLARYLGIKRVRFATEAEVEQIMHCKVGACYPFGSFINTRVVVDPTLPIEEKIAFNPGKNDQSIIMSCSDYLKVACPEIQDIAKNS